MYMERKKEAEAAEEQLKRHQRDMKTKKKAVALERRSVKHIKRELGHAHTAVQKLNEIRLSQVNLGLIINKPLRLSDMVV